MIGGLAWYTYVRSNAPEPSLVNGVYTNACCGSLTLRDGVIIAGQTRIHFTLENMKFGLRAYPTNRLAVRGSEVVVLPVAKGETPSLAFDTSGTALKVCGDQLCSKTYVFKRN